MAAFSKKLYELTATQVAKLLSHGLKPLGLGYIKPNGHFASVDDINLILKKKTRKSEPVDRYIYSRILTKAKEQSQLPGKTKEAREWFREKAMNYRAGRIDKSRLMTASRQTTQIQVGRMYMFVYDAKWKAILPYWDAFPIIFPIKKVAGGFHGINLHYLPPILRAKLMDALYECANNDRFDRSTKLNISYNILRAAGTSRLFKPCYKHYLDNHVRSPFMAIDAKEWEIAAFLPLANWQKASQADVWRESAGAVG